jgi:hypothetical protein
VALTGHFEGGGAVDFGGGPLTGGGGFTNIFVAEFDSAGNHLWSHSLWTEFGYAVSYGIATDDSGNVFLAGEFSGTLYSASGSLTSAGGSDIVIAKYSPAGSRLWWRSLGGTGLDQGFDIAPDDLGNVIATGSFSGTVDFGGGTLTSVGEYDAFIAKFDSAGAHLWSKRYGATSTIEYGWDLAVDHSMNVVMAGSRSSFPSGVPTLLTLRKLDPAGNELWSETFSVGGMGDARGVAVDAAGNIFLTGWFMGAVDFGGGSLASAGDQDIFVAKFDSSGNHIWSQRYGGGVLDAAYGIALGDSGSVLTAGTFDGTVDFRGGSLVSAGGGDIFVAKFDSSGNHLWSERFGDWNNQLSSLVAANGSGSVMLTGHYYGTVDFGDGPLTSAGDTDIFLAGFIRDSATGVGSDAPTPFSIVSVSPNPFNPSTTVHFTLPAAMPVSVDILSVTGARVRVLVDQRPVGPGDIRLIWDGRNDHGAPVASGVYLVRVKTQLGTQVARAVLLK